MSERIQKTFTLSFNSKINSDLKMWEALQKLPKGYGKKLFQSLLEEKFGKPNTKEFELKMMKYLDLTSDSDEGSIDSLKTTLHLLKESKTDDKHSVEATVIDEKTTLNIKPLSRDSLEI